MSTTTTIDRLRSILDAQLSIAPAEVEPDSSLRGDLGMDSLDAMEFITILSEEFAVQIDDEDLKTLATISDVVTMLDQRVAANGLS